jgi:septum formation protein
VSPRRLELLRQIAIVPDLVIPAAIDETPWRNELPRDHVQRVASEKLETVASQHRDAFILAGDTVVAMGRRILPKAENEVTARRCLEALSGRRHRVFGAVALADPSGRRRIKVSLTTVQFQKLDDATIASYLASGEWQGKAGGYAIQGRAAGFASFLSGSYSNVVGLDLHVACALLRGAGWTT